MALAGQQFDFVSFLKIQFPEATYEIERLTGGLVNETVRAINSSSGSSSNPISIVLKYAPPFVAGRGPEVPFGQQRQLVEAAALELVAESESPLRLKGLLEHVVVPQLLFNNQDAHVLALGDLGDLDSLTVALNGRSTIEMTVESATHIGKQLGLYFAALHSPQIFTMAKGQEAGMALASYREPRALVKSVVVDRIGELLESCGFSEMESSRLALVVSNSWTACEADASTALTHGDAWPGSILVGDKHNDEANLNSGDSQIALIDWEFAHFNSSGVASDIAIFLAHVRLHSIAAVQMNKPLLKKCCDALVVALSRSYRTHSMELGAPWPNTLCSIESDRDTTICTLLQRLVITVGRELIYNALEMPWNCTCCKDDYQDDSQCALRQLMVEEGVRYLQRAHNFRTCLDFVENDDYLAHLLKS